MNLKKAAIMLLTGCMLMGFSCGCSKGKAEAEYHTDVKAGNTCGNIANMGSVAQVGDKLYYQSAEDGFSIYSSDVNGENALKLNENESYFINVSGDYIYYVNGGDDYHIYRMKTDGSENTKLNDTQSYYLNVYGDKLYYSNWSDECKIYSMSTEGGDATCLSDDQAYYVSVDKDKIYYSNWSDGARLYSMDLDGGNPLKLTETGCWYPVPAGDYVYYSRWENIGENAEENTDNDKFLYKVNKNGSENIELNTVPSGDINVYKDRVYYTNWTDNTINSIGIDGSDPQVVSETYGVYLNLAANKLYYVEYDEDKNPSLKTMDINTQNDKEK